MNYKKLLTWFRKHQRVLPWRGESDPYKIWVSEVMLQQTQVTTVIPYYQRFINLYPTMYDLAAATIRSLMKAWEGLGYYRRASSMHETAQYLVTHNNGHLPTKRDELIELKGFGDYTASSVASIAFGERCAAIDGNVLRVASRYFLVNEDIGLPPTRLAIKQLVEAYLPPAKHISEFNQGLMELGATICKKSNPTCEACPLSDGCGAFREQRTDKYPVKKKRAKTPHYRVAVGAVLRKGKVLIGLRKPNALLGNLWEFPGGKIEQDETAEDACIRELKEETGLSVKILEGLPLINHAYTHFKVTLYPFICHSHKGNPEPRTAVELKWVNIQELNEYAFPKSNHPILKYLNTKT